MEQNSRFPATKHTAGPQILVMDAKNLNELNQRRRANGEFGNKYHAEAEGELGLIDLFCSVRELLDRDGPVSLSGGMGGVLTVDGEVYESSVIPGLIAVEVEIGTLYLDPDSEVNINSKQNLPLCFGKETILASQLIEDLDYSALVGASGGSTVITGSVYASSKLPDMLVVETEHGSVYLDPDSEINVASTVLPVPNQLSGLDFDCVADEAMSAILQLNTDRWYEEINGPRDVTISDINSKDKDEWKQMIAKWAIENADDVKAYLDTGHDASQLGYDYLLTKSGHGTGFWDRGNEDFFQRLSSSTGRDDDADYAWVDDDGSVRLNGA